MTLKLLSLLLIGFFLTINADIAPTTTISTSQSTPSTNSIAHDLNKNTFLGDNAPYIIQDDETVVTYNSWGQNIENSLGSFIIGVILILFGFPILWFNERRFIKERQIIISGHKVCAETTPSYINPDNDEELVHLCGFANTTEELYDSAFGLTLANALRLKRVVEVYQVKERVERTTENDSFGGGSRTVTRYHYENVWSETKIDSSNFHEHAKRDSNNRVSFISKTQLFDANIVNIGEYMLNKSQIARLEKFDDLEINEDILGRISPEIIAAIHELPFEISLPNLLDKKYIIVARDKYDHHIGDTRISFQVVKSSTLTLVSQQSGRTFVPYDIKRKKFRRYARKTVAKGLNAPLIDADQRTWTCDIFDKVLEYLCFCCCCCKFIERTMKEDEEIDWIFQREMTKDEVFDYEEEQNESNTNIFRGVGWLCLVIGIWLLFKPIVVFFSFISFLGSLIDFAAFIIGLVLGSVLAIMVIALSWIVHRPLIAIPLLLIGGTVLGLFIFHTQSAAQTTSSQIQYGYC